MTFTTTPNDFGYGLMGQVSVLERLTLYVDEGQWTQANIKGKVSNLEKGLGKMAKNQSLPAPLQEKYSRGEENLTMHEHLEKPTAWWPRPSLSNPHSTNDIVWAFLCTNPTPLRFVTNRVLTIIIIIIQNMEPKKQILNIKETLFMFLNYL